MACDFQQCGMCDQQSLRSASANAQSDLSLFLSLEHSINIKLLAEHHLEFLSLKGGCSEEARLSLHMSNATLLEISCTGSVIIECTRGFDVRIVKAL